MSTNKFIPRNCLAMIGLMLVFTTAARGEFTTPTGTVITPSNSCVTVSTSGTELINVYLDDVDIAAVVHMFSQISGINIIYNPTSMEGRVSCSLTGVELCVIFRDTSNRS